MNKDQAFKIMELSPGASEEEIRKQFKKLAAKYHPDINKSPEAEAKSKEISEAFNYLKNPPPDPIYSDFHTYSSDPFNYQNDPFFSMYDFVNKTYQKEVKFHTSQPINLNIDLSFEESILGCSRQLKYKKNVQCAGCKGSGNIKENTICVNCNGRGQVTSTAGTITVVRTCDKCYGLGKTLVKHSDCKGQGSISKDIDITVKIPGGLQGGSQIRLNHGGHFVNGQYTDAFIKISVKSDPEMKLVGLNVMSTLSISLLESLKGCTKKVRTVKGEVDLVIPPKQLHQDNVDLSGYGANGENCHRFILNVNLPSNTDKLIEFLENNKD